MRLSDSFFNFKFLPAEGNPRRLFYGVDNI